MCNIQDYSVLYNKAVLPVICEAWHFTHMLVIFVLPNHVGRCGPVALVSLRHILLKCVYPTHIDFAFVPAMFFVFRRYGIFLSFIGPLYCLCFDLRLMITYSASSNFSIILLKQQ